MKVSQAYNQSKGWLRPWIIHSSFRIHIIGKRFYTRLLAFELNFFIWPYSLNIFNSLCQITQSNHAIFNSTNRFLYTATFVDTWASILHLTEMRTLQFDTHSVNFATRCVVFQTRPRIFSTQLWNFRFRSFSALSSIMLCEKKGVCRQHTSFTSCQNAACSFET